MKARSRFFTLAALGVLLISVVGSVVVISLYRVGLAREGDALAEVVRSQVSLAEAVFLDELEEHGRDTASAIEGTLAQVLAAQRRFVGFGRTGELTMARRVGDTLVYEIGLRRDTTRMATPIPLPSDLGEPAQHAVAGETGVIRALDYSGVLVLAAYAPVPGTGLGMVAKMDLAEVRAPYVGAAFLAAGVAGMLILIALALALRVGAPLLEEVEERESAHRAFIEHLPGVAFRAVCDAGGRWRFDFVEGDVAGLTGQPAARFLADFDAWLALFSDADGSDVVQQVEALRRGEPARTTAEHRLLRADGSPRWVRVALDARRGDGDGTVVHGVALDVTELRTKEDALGRTRRALALRHALAARLAQAESEDKVWPAVCDVLVNDGGYRMAWVGVPECDAGRAVRPVACAGDDEGYVAGIPASWSEEGPHGQGPTGRALRAGTVQVARDIESDPAMSPWRAAARERGFRSSAALPIPGQERPMGVLNAYAPEADAFDGEELALLQELADDVARRVALLRAAGERSVLESRFQAFMDASPSIAWIKDAEGRHLYVNRAWEAVFGLTTEGWQGKTGHDLAPREVADVWSAHDREVLEKGTAVAAVEMSVDAGGRRRIWQSVEFPLGSESEEILVGGMAIEITDLVEAEEALRRSEERLRLAVRAGGHGLWDLDLRTGRAEVNQEYASMIGYDPATFVETHAAWLDRLHPDDRDRVDRIYEAHARGELTAYDVEFRQRTADGGWRWTRSVGEFAEWDEEGKPVRMLGTHTDIQALKDAEAALRESEDRFRRAVESAPDAIFIQSRGCFAYVNPEALRLFGAERPSQMVGRPVVDSVLSEERAATAERIRQFKEERRAQPPQVHILVRLDGSRVNAEFSGVPFRFDGEDGALVFARDVTKRLEAEEQIRGHLDELQRWQAVMLDREDRVQELKREVNELCHLAGAQPRYGSQAGRDAETGPTP